MGGCINGWTGMHSPLPERRSIHRTSFFIFLVDGCAVGPCGANATCEITDARFFTCTCNAGFVGDGFSCQGKLVCYYHRFAR